MTVRDDFSYLRCLVKKYDELSNRALQSYFNTKHNIYRFNVIIATYDFQKRNIRYYVLYN